MGRFLGLLVALSLTTLGLVSQGHADVIDPATIHVGPGGTTGCATGGCYVFGNEVNGIPGGTLDLFQESGGANPLVSSVLLILAVPNDTTGTVLSALNVSSTATLDDPSGNPVPPPVTVAFGVVNPTGDAFGPTGAGLTGGTAGFQGFLGAGEEVYGFLGIGDKSNNSEQFGKFQAADLAAAGVTVANNSDYGLYVYSIETSGFAGKDFLQLDVSDIPQGTFVMGYGQDAYTHLICKKFHRGICTKYGYSDYTLYGTPFTEVGLTTKPPRKVPEPASLMMLASGLMLVGTLVRRQLRG